MTVLISVAFAVTPVTDATTDDVTDSVNSDNTIVASVGEIQFTTLQQAIDETSGNIKIKLENNVSRNSPTNPTSVWTMLTIPQDRTVTLDLNGFTIDADLHTDSNTYENAQVVRNEGTLVIKDSSENHTGTISSDVAYGCTATLRNQNGTMTIDSGNIICNGGNAIRNQNGLLTINGGTVSTTGLFGTFDNGTSAIHNRGDVVINNGNITTENQAPVWYGLGSDDSTTKIYGGTFNSTNTGVDIQGNDGTVEVMGGKFHVDPSNYLRAGYFLSVEDGYYVISTPESSVTVHDSTSLINAVENAQGTTGITISGDITLSQNLTIPENAYVHINEGSTLSLADSVLTLNGFLINDGYLDVSHIGDGFLNNLYRYMEQSGSVIGLMEPNDDDVYEIGTPAELQLMHFVMLYNCDEQGIFSKDILLTDDIDLDGYNFLPLGYDANVAFGGTFMGDGKTIFNLSVDIAYGYLGLFSVLDSATVENLSLNNITMVTQTGVMGSLAGGAFGGGNFTDISISGTYTNAGSYYCGGWIGFLRGTEGDTFNFLNCHNDVDVTGYFNVGAFWGSSSGSKAFVTLIDCSNSGDIRATGGTVGLVGGFVSGSGVTYNFHNSEDCGIYVNNVEQTISTPLKNAVDKTMESIVAISVNENGMVPYDSIADAVNNAPANILTTITIQTNVSEDVVVTSRKNITLDLNGNTITNASGHTITVQDGATFTITGDGTVDNLTHQKAAVYNLGTFTLVSGTLTRSKEAGISPSDNGGNSWYVVDNHGTMVVKGGTIEADGDYSSLIRNIGTSDDDRASLTIEGGFVSNRFNTVKNDDYGDLTITGGTIESERQAVQNWADAVILGGTMNGEVHTYTYQDMAASLTVDRNAVINGNLCAIEYILSGGSLDSITDPTVNIKGGTINGTLSTMSYDADTETYETLEGGETGEYAWFDVSGGTFTAAVEDRFVTDGTILVPNDDGYYGTITTDKALIRDSGTTIAPIVTDSSSYVLTSSGPHTDVTVTIQFRDGTIVINGNFQKGAYTVVLEDVLP